MPGVMKLARQKGGWLACLPFFFLLACSDPTPTPRAEQPSPEDAQSFLARHWQRPLAPQGYAPAHFSSLEAALDPSACGSCHTQQLADWRGSWHAKALGPGVLGQLLDMPANDRDAQQDCIRCHAPLAEQADSLVAAIAGQTKTGLHAEGLVCAACHVREHRRFGPPRRDGSVAKPQEKLPHDGWQPSAAFADSRFCAACHQFDADGFALNGKLLENTYNEWQESPAARQGKTCQSCHMPDRRHLWRGVHDPDTVRSGVTISHDAPRLQTGVVQARLSIVNSGTGHHFPTYVTPRVVAAIEQTDAAGRALPGTRREYLIARQVTLDLAREIADTRLAPGAVASLDYQVPRHTRAARLDYRVRVEPDAFYTEVYRSLLSEGAATQGRKLIRQALDAARTSPFLIYAESAALPQQTGKP